MAFTNQFFCRKNDFLGVFIIILKTRPQTGGRWQRDEFCHVVMFNRWRYVCKHVCEGDNREF